MPLKVRADSGRIFSDTNETGLSEDGLGTGPRRGLANETLANALGQKGPSHLLLIVSPRRNAAVANFVLFRIWESAVQRLRCSDKFF